MSISSAVVKKTAKTALKGKYPKAVITAAVYVFVVLSAILCTGLFSYFGGKAAGVILFLLLLVFLIFPLTLGYVYFNIQLIFTSGSEPVLISKYFSCKKAYKRAVKFSVLITAKAVITGAILFIPAFITDLMRSGKIFMLLGMKVPVWTSSLWAVSSFLKTAAIIFLLFIMLKYYISPFLIATDENMEPQRAIYMSKVVSVYTIKDFIWLVLSFTGYILACLLIIPVIFILPYLSVAFAVHQRFGIAAYNENIDKIISADTPSFSADISF